MSSLKIAVVVVFLSCFYKRFEKFIFLWEPFLPRHSIKLACQVISYFILFVRGLLGMARSFHYSKPSSAFPSNSRDPGAKCEFLIRACTNLGTTSLAFHLPPPCFLPHWPPCCFSITSNLFHLQDFAPSLPSD